MASERIIHVKAKPPFSEQGTAESPSALQEAIAAAASSKDRTIIHLEPGTYRLPWPLRLGPEFSNVEFRGSALGEVIFDGGQDLADWRENVLENSGSAPKRVWTADATDLLASDDEPKFFIVNGKPAARCRFPEDGCLSTSKSESRLSCAVPKAILAAGRHDDWELVLYYDWVCRRLKVTAVDPEGIDFVPDKTKWGKEAAFAIENMPLEFLSPGHWKLDRATGRIFYMPREGESLAGFRATVPIAQTLVELRGDPDGGKFVKNVVFAGITFRHTGDGRLINSNQADWNCSAAATLMGALNCRFEHCTFTNLSGWGVSLEDGCRKNEVSNCRFENLGAGGVMAHGAADPESPRLTGWNHIERNTMRHGGITWGGAVAVLLRHSCGNLVSGNEISHFRYSGISCGWTWGYGENISRDNTIEGNHIHHLGTDGLLADMGGIYTLGIQPGTVIRGNVIHDIQGKSISWGIYLDEGSSHILVEENLVYRIASECFHVHYGRRNVVRNNIFAFAKDGICSITRGTMDIQCHFTRGDIAASIHNNILISDGAPVYVKYILDYEIKEDLHCLEADGNILQFLHGATRVVAADGFHCYDRTYTEKFDIEAWKREGFDRESTVLGPEPEEIPESVLQQNISPAARALYERLRHASAASPNEKL